MYFVNGYKFHTESHGSIESTSNSGVCIKGTNSSDNEIHYYGRLIEVLRLEYPGLPIKCTYSSSVSGLILLLLVG